MDLSATLLLALVVGAAGGAFTWRRVQAQGEDNPRTIGIGAGIIAAIAVVLIRYFFW